MCNCKATKTYRNGFWRIVLDSDQVFPRDPGNGTPAMVYHDRKGAKGCSTLWCATGTGVVDGDDGDVEIPEHIQNWLCDHEDVANEFITLHSHGEVSP